MPKNLGSTEFPWWITETFLPLLLFEYEWHNIMQQEKGGGLSGTLESRNENQIDERSNVMPELPQTRGEWNAGEHAAADWWFTRGQAYMILWVGGNGPRAVI